MKKPANLLSIVVIVLALLQVLLMFLPYWTLTDAPTKKVPDPQPVDYSMQSLCWTKTEDMSKIFKAELKEKDQEFDINKNVENLVLTFFAGVGAIVLLLVNIKNIHSGFQTASATLVRVLGYIIPFVWAFFGINGFFDSQVMGMGNQGVFWASVVLFFVGIAVGVARLVFVFMPQKKVSA